MTRLTHIDGDGHLAMVDVSDKAETRRVARARAEVRMARSTADALRGSALPKGDATAVARLAGVMAAKRTAELIPLCHSLGLDHVDVKIEILEDRAIITSEAATIGRTGVEMEALTAASVAALTLYDMAKAVDRGMVIEGLCLIEKVGGRSGHWKRDEVGSP